MPADIKYGNVHRIVWSFHTGIFLIQLCAKMMFLFPQPLEKILSGTCDKLKIQRS